MKTTSRLARFLGFAFVCGTLIGNASFAQAPAVAKDAKKFVAYRITRGDFVSVGVMGESDLTAGRRRVEATGTVNLPLIAEIRLVGLTVLEAQEAIGKAYRDQRFLRNPQVTVTVDEYSVRSVRVSGKVGQPGLVHMPPDVEFTLLDAISKAGGLGDTANGKSVRISRTLPDGTLTLIDNLDVESALKAKNKPTLGDATFVLQPDDIIYVPERII
jgi:polysaccharide export outer membrane protein